MASTDFIARGMNPIQAVQVAEQLDGRATGFTSRLIGLGFPVPLANELNAQMVAGTGNASNLRAFGVPTLLAEELATQITATDADT